MNIGIIHPSFDIIGGAEQTTISILNALKNTSYKVTLYTTTKNIKIPSEIKICLVKRTIFPIGWTLQRILENKQIFKKAKNEDLLLISSGNLILFDTKKEIIIYCHSTFESELKNLKMNKSGLMKIYYKYIQNQIKIQIKYLKNSSVKLIANSNYTLEKIKEVFEKDSTMIYPPVKMVSKSNKKEGIITIARYSKEKNLDFNIRVIQNLDVNYKIFGNAKFSSQIEYYKFLQGINNNKQIKLFLNSNRNLIEESLQSSKIYFQSSEETFGISVIEGIMAGCIPIVPNNTGNKETVPVDKLRYIQNDLDDAKKKIESALRGDYDKYLPELQEYVKKFSEETFQKNIIRYLSKFEKNKSAEQDN